MLEITSRKPVMVFKVLDRSGRTIGEVVQPRMGASGGAGCKNRLVGAERTTGS
jgi:hypothetical protein